MPKLKLDIDLGVDFRVAAQVEAFGFEAAVGLRRKKAAGMPKLSKEDVVDLGAADYKELDSESSEPSDQ